MQTDSLCKEQLTKLQHEEKEQKIIEENERDVWLEMILKQRSFLAEREAQQEVELERMADDISSSLISMDKGNIDESSIYINTSELKQWIKKRRA
jgi:hypothetical protein